MTDTPNVDPVLFSADWARWHAERVAGVLDPLGVASLTSTNWLGDTPQQIEGVPGSWRAVDGRVVAEGLADSRVTTVGEGTPVGDAVRLRFQEEVRDGERLLRAFGRDGVLALRVLDPATPRRVTLRGIEAHRPDPEWKVLGRFIPGNGAEIDITQIDGHVSRGKLGGTIELTVAGHDVALTVTPTDGSAFSAVFGDSTNGIETYRFRFLRIPQPDGTGHVPVDFNRAYLPPCAFSDHYICPLPSPGNRYDFPIRAGERTPVYAT